MTHPGVPTRPLVRSNTPGLDFSPINGRTVFCPAPKPIGRPPKHGRGLCARCGLPRGTKVTGYCAPCGRAYSFERYRRISGRSRVEREAERAAAREARVRRCPTCDRPADFRRRYCSDTCTPRRPCLGCESPAAHQRRYCSTECRQRVALARYQARKPGCRTCGDKQPPGRWYCDTHRPKQELQRTFWKPRPAEPQTRLCEHCQQPFATRVSIQRYCSRRCKSGRHNKRRFPPIPRVRRLLIADRDGWRCGFCHAVIDPVLRWPHLGSLSIDHIDPKGAHDPANWQASHLVCNVQAGAKRAVA